MHTNQSITANNSSSNVVLAFKQKYGLTHKQVADLLYISEIQAKRLATGARNITRRTQADIERLERERSY